LNFFMKNNLGTKFRRCRKGGEVLIYIRGHYRYVVGIRDKLVIVDGLVKTLITPRSLSENGFCPNSLELSKNNARR